MLCKKKCYMILMFVTSCKNMIKRFVCESPSFVLLSASNNVTVDLPDRNSVCQEKKVAISI